MTPTPRPDRKDLIGLLLRYNGIPHAGEGDPYYDDAAKMVDKFLAGLESRPSTEGGMTIGDAIDHLTEAREHLKGGTPEYIAVVAAHDILRDFRESPPQAPAAPSPDLLEAARVTAPDRIWLNHGADDHSEMTPQEWRNGEVTWCWHNVHGNDIEYIRADLASTPRPPEAVKADTGALDLEAIARELEIGWRFAQGIAGDRIHARNALWRAIERVEAARLRSLPPESSPKAGDVEALAKQAVRELGFLDTEEQVDYLANFAREAIRLSSGLTHGQVRAFDMGGWPDGKIVEIDADGTYRSASTPAVYEVRRKSEAPVSGKEGDRT